MSVVGLARTRGVVLLGVDGHVVEVEADVSQGVVGFTVVGLADKGVGEARDRARSALLNSGLHWPAMKITIGLSPAWLPKRGPTLDLPVALAVLATQGSLPREALAELVCVAELGLDGRLRAVRGALVAALAARAAGARRLIVPAANLAEAELVPGIDVAGFHTLAGLVAALCDEPLPDRELDAALTAAARPPSRVDSGGAVADLSDVRGQLPARAALELAAAGGHHVAMTGAPGIGKTMLAERLPGLLPELDEQAALEVTSVHSVAGTLAAGELIRVPPFVAPHHTVTFAAMVGGGSAVPRIGQVSLAHHGVLFLDESPEFDARALEALRQPLESGWITVSRSAFVVRYPASFQLVLAMNPCPCGRDDTGRTGAGRHCICTSVQRRRYLARISGPLVDRVDVRVTLSRPTMAELADDVVEATAVVAGRVGLARERAAHRFVGTPFRVNGDVPGPVLRRRFPLHGDAAGPVEQAVARGLLSARGADRVLRVAWTVADLAGHDQPSLTDVGTALALREPGTAWAA
ncbi:MAG TPA: YifB family Mg chelatase-like AAA ATPase [Candidatus Nanopelagicales bacterium]|jgi:magnesium chelatase family protein